jgi:hypothetical protein
LPQDAARKREVDSLLPTRGYPTTPASSSLHLIT